jgi:creatinine amidohydrolase
MTSDASKHRYAELTWPEVAEAVAEDPVCLIPVATLEDHGYHLPIDTDARIAETLAERAVMGRNESGVRPPALLLPTVTHGYTPHHMDFPGPITIDWKLFVDYLLEIGRSLCHHGFRRFLYVNGHGSNVPLVEMAARLLMVERPGTVAGAFWYLSSAESSALLERTRDSERPGGMAHACELETSLYLAIAPELVQMDKAVREVPDWGSQHVWMDWNDGPLAIRERWSAWSESGVVGDATLATAEKGRIWLEQAVKEIVDYIDEVGRRPLGRGRDHHTDGFRRPMQQAGERDGSRAKGEDR